MNRRWVNLVLTALIVLAMTESAHAQFGVGPFVFNFFNSALAAVFLLPFSLVGCG